MGLFVSYTQDRSWAEWIAWILEENGYRVLVQAQDFVPGTNWTQHMQDGTGWTMCPFSERRHGGGAPTRDQRIMSPYSAGAQSGETIRRYAHIA